MIIEEIKSGYACGYSENYIKIYAKGSALPGEIVPVRIERIENGKVFGVIPERIKTNAS